MGILVDRTGSSHRGLPVGASARLVRVELHQQGLREDDHVRVWPGQPREVEFLLPLGPFVDGKARHDPPRFGAACGESESVE